MGMDKFFAGQRWFTKSGLSLGDDDQQEFDSLKEKSRGFFGAVTGLRLRATANVDESTAAAALAHETLRNIIDSITLTLPTREFCSGLQGRDLWQVLTDGQILAGNAADLVHIADIASSEDSNAMAQEYLIPFAIGRYLRNNFSEEDELVGAVPISMLKKHGSLYYHILSSLGGNWRLNAGTEKLTVTADLDCVYTKEPISYVPSFMRAEDKSESDYSLVSGGAVVSVPFVGVFDDDYSTFTSPTEPRIEIDDSQVQGLVSGDSLNRARSWKCDGLREAYLDDGYTVFSSLDANEPGGWPSGKSIILRNCGAQHSGDVRYVAFCYQETSATDIAQQLDDTGIKGKVAEEIVADFSAFKPMGVDGKGSPRVSRVLYKGLPAAVKIDKRRPGRGLRAFSLQIGG